MRKMVAALMLPIGFLLLVGCQEEVVSRPLPVALTSEAVGVYCGMVLTEHVGPKAQVFEKYRETPQWFTSVRDAISYLTLPGEAQDAVAIYVHDMGRAQSWNAPQNDGIWISADDAYFVIGSRKIGGMGSLEFVPFEKKEQAEKFRQEYGGRIARISEITHEDLIAEVPSRTDHLRALEGHSDHD